MYMVFCRTETTPYYVHSLHKVARIEAIPPFQQTQEEAAAGSGAERAERAADRASEWCWGRWFEGKQKSTKQYKTYQKHAKAMETTSRFGLILFVGLDDLSIDHSSFQSISMSTVKICKVFLKIDLWSFLISWRVPFFCRLPRDKSWTCCVSQTKRSTDWQDLTRVDTFWCQTTSEMWVIYVEVLRSILRTFLVFDLSNTLTLINLNVTIRSIQ